MSHFRFINYKNVAHIHKKPIFANKKFKLWNLTY